MSGCIKDDGCDNDCTNCLPSDGDYVLVYHFTFDVQFGRALLAEQVEARACWHFEDRRRAWPSVITITGIGGDDAHLLPGSDNDFERQLWAQAVHKLAAEQVHIDAEWDRRDRMERVGNGNWMGDFSVVGGRHV